MHLIDSLSLGGAESVAVNLVNALSRDRYKIYLCTTRKEGPLAARLVSDVGRLRLYRRWRFDVSAVQRLVSFIGEYKIKLLHAHGSTLFIAVLAAQFCKQIAIVWHDHYGRMALDDRPPFVYILGLRRVNAVIAVNLALKQWAIVRARVPTSRVWYIPNFIPETKRDSSSLELPGTPGFRIVCVANLRPQKDHSNLLQAMARVSQVEPAAHLVLVGAGVDSKYAAGLQREVTQLGLASHVTWLGARKDVPSILRNCDIGVLSSASEGLPLALLEYGAAGLAAVATRAGQCAEVLDDQRAGLLVEPGDPVALSNAIIKLLQSPAARASYAERLKKRIQLFYSATAVVAQVEQVYEVVLHSGTAEST